MLQSIEEALLCDRIQKELTNIRRVAQRIDVKLVEVLHTVPDHYMLARLIGYLHSFYYGFEKIFKLISKYVDLFEPGSESYNSGALLKQMTQSIQGVRPSILRPKLASELEAYLNLHYFLHHSENHKINWEDLKPKLIRSRSVFNQAEIAIQDFIVFLKKRKPITNRQNGKQLRSKQTFVT